MTQEAWALAAGIFARREAELLERLETVRALTAALEAARGTARVDIQKRLTATEAELARHVAELRRTCPSAQEDEALPISAVHEIFAPSTDGWVLRGEISGRDLRRAIRAGETPEIAWTLGRRVFSRIELPRHRPPTTRSRAWARLDLWQRQNPAKFAASIADTNTESLAEALRADLLATDRIKASKSSLRDAVKLYRAFHHRLPRS